MKIIIKRFETLTNEELYEILKVRVSVFVVEQKCYYQEIDDKDKYAFHMMLMDESRLIAYLRVLDPGIYTEDASIGRVLTVERGLGYGEQILKAGINLACTQFPNKHIRIEAQSYAKDFYAKAGFIQVSDEFLEDGIPHIKMVLKCTSQEISCA